MSKAVISILLEFLHFFLEALSTVCLRHRGPLNYNLAKKGIVLILTVPFTISLFAQSRRHDPLKENYPVIQNQGWTNEIGKTYQRLPNRAEKEVRKPVWDLSGNSAGLAIHFYTNAEKIEIRYEVKGNLAMSHMPSTGVSGVDLYAIDSDGKWRLATGKFNFSDTITYTYEGLPQSQYHKSGFEYRLYLPLYNSVKWMEIGVPDSAEFRFIPACKEKPIVVYGTSIAQGGCASRPGMGWTNILSRTLDYPVINLAFSGNGPLEKELVDLIDEMDVSLYIYDCLPNMGSLSSDEVLKRTMYGVNKIREKHDAPILLVDHIGYRNHEMNKSSEELGNRMNNALRQAYDSLVNLGIKNIYHLHKDTIDFPDDGCVDNIHPSDLGMQAYADAYEKIIRKILSMPAGDLKTTQPVSQRREPYIYEWKERHDNILQSIQLKDPKRVIMGNSITHYWGGSAGHENGSRSWKKQMKPAGYLNLGQPKAKIKVIGLLPRRGEENHVKAINGHIVKMVLLQGYTYLDVGNRLSLKNGKIDETLFLDGLHPNEEGYLLIVNDIMGKY